MRKSGIPRRWEIVICQITKINPNSAFAKLVEYDKTGMIHVSEVASGWVRDIREFLRENQYVVCLVTNVDSNMISLSVKRVKKDEANRKLNDFKRESRAEKLFEITAKSFKKTLDEAYEEVGYKLIEECGSLSKTFEIALKNDDLLRSKGIPEKWVVALSDLAKKSFSEKIFEVKVEVNLISYKPDGVEIIRSILSKAETDGFDVKYISAPKYVISGSGKNHKDLESKIQLLGESMIKQIKKAGGEGSFKIVQN
jgi:translation initiation factor 2 subunit 1